MVFMILIIKNKIKFSPEMVRMKNINITINIYKTLNILTMKELIVYGEALR